jgi:signal peptidase I
MQPSEPRHSTSPTRVLIHGAVGLLCAALIANTWLVGGLLVPAVVHGGSMAPSLLGAHYRWQCRACGHAFACDAQSAQIAGGAGCPGCGQLHSLDEGQQRPAERVWVDRTAYGWRAPKRWEAVVLNWPDEPSQWCVKRVVGLPGEWVTLQDGDVVVNGRVVCKPVGVQRAMAVSVAKGPSARDRWQSERPGAWVWKGDVCVHPADRGGAVDWLVYHHADHAVAQGESQPPIRDGSNYHPDESRKLNPVSDVVLRFEVQGAASETCVVRARVGGDDFRIAIPLGRGSLRLTHNGNRKRARQVDNKPGKPVPIELMISDRRLRILVSDKPALEYDFRPTPIETPPPLLLELGTSGAGIQVGKLEVLRDVYYTPAGRETRQYRLGENEYFVLGDNSPHSVDSRHWPSGGVVASMLLGPALTWSGRKP